MLSSMAKDIIEINSSYNLESAKVVIKNLNVKYGTK